MKFFCVTIFDFYVDVLLGFFFYIVWEKTSVSAAEFYHMTYDASLFWCIFSFFFLLLIWDACIWFYLTTVTSYLIKRRQQYKLFSNTLIVNPALVIFVSLRATQFNVCRARSYKVRTCKHSDTNAQTTVSWCLLKCGQLFVQKRLLWTYFWKFKPIERYS